MRILICNVQNIRKAFFFMSPSEMTLTGLKVHNVGNNYSEDNL